MDQKNQDSLLGFIIFILIVLFIIYKNKKRKEEIKNLIELFFTTQYFGSFNEITKFIQLRSKKFDIDSDSHIKIIRAYISELIRSQNIKSINDEYWIRNDVFNSIYCHLKDNIMISMNDISNNIFSENLHILLTNSLMDALAKINLVENLAPNLWRSNLAVDDTIEKEVIVL